MPWALLIGLFLDRMAKGFPWLSEWINRNKPALVAMAEKVKPSAAVKKTEAVGFKAAPQELKDMLQAFLKQMQAKATGFVVKFLIGQLISLSSTWADEIWDSLFAAAAAGGEPAVTFGAGPVSAEAVAFADCCAAFKA